MLNFKDWVSQNIPQPNWLTCALENPKDQAETKAMWADEYREYMGTVIDPDRKAKDGK